MVISITSVDVGFASVPLPCLLVGLARAPSMKFKGKSHRASADAGGDRARPVPAFVPVGVQSGCLLPNPCHPAAL